MATGVIDQPIKDGYGEQVAVPGSASDPIIIPWRHGYREILLEAAAASYWLIAPNIKHILFFDNSQTGQAKWVDVLGASDGLLNSWNTGSTGTILDSWNTTDYLYVAFDDRAGGIRVETAAVNGTASVLTAGYSKSDKTFAAQAITDGSASGGVTLAQDGNITLDAIPADWVKLTLFDILGKDVVDGAPGGAFYWLRFDVSVTLDTDVELDVVLPISRHQSTNGVRAKAAQEYTIDIDGGALQLVAQAAGATTAEISWFKR